MIYLVQDQDYIKIGHTIDFGRYKRTLNRKNLYSTIIAYKEGSLKDKAKIKELCKDYIHEGDWFINCQIVKDTFNNYKSETEPEN